MPTYAKVDTKNFNRKQKRVIRAKREAIHRALGDYLDKVRILAADKYIIASTVDKRKSYAQMAKSQPVDSMRLTERTGALKDMLKNKGNGAWKIGARKLSNWSNIALKGLIRTADFGTDHERYMAHLKVNIAQSNPWLGKRLVGKRKFYGYRDEEGKTQYEAVYKRETSKTLAIRFRHEKGLRGHARPFVGPAAKEIKPDIRSIFDHYRSLIRVHGTK